MFATLKRLFLERSKVDKRPVPTASRRKKNFAKRTNAADIIGIGAQKSATSWASFILNQHPRVFIPSEHAFSKKEVGFFNGEKWDKGVDWYKEIMAPPTRGQLSLDVTPAYAFADEERVKLCHQLSPKARIFYLLRNPVDRDWSSLVMEASRKNFDVENATREDIMKFYEERKIDRHSQYEAAIEKWSRFYAKDQLFIRLYDDVSADPAAVFKDLCRHVGINPTRVDHWGRKVRRQVFKGPGTVMPQDIRDHLSIKYTPMIKRLGPLIGRDLSRWLL